MYLILPNNDTQSFDDQMQSGAFIYRMENRLFRYF